MDNNSTQPPQSPAKPSKYEVAKALILNSSIFVHFTTHNGAVFIPDHLKNKDQVVLQFGYNMTIPIPDLSVSLTGISGTLSFKGESHFCFVPWGKVFAIVGENGRGAMYPEDMPQSILSDVQAGEKRQQMKLASSQPTTRVERLLEEAKPTEKKRGHLTLVKN